jgi:DNA-directed RNA polymerase specialized sigma24 family protein
MKINDDCFADVIEGLKTNRPEAFSRLWNEFYTDLVRYADRKLAALPRRSSDEEDIALAAMHSLHVGLQKGHFPDIATKTDLQKLLYVITAREAKQEIRKQMAAKRGGGEVRGDSVFFAPDENAGFNEIADSRGYSPTETLLPIDCTELLEKLEDDLQRWIVRLKFQGYGVGEIAIATGVTERTIERKLVRVRELLGDDALDQWGVT